MSPILAPAKTQHAAHAMSGTTLICKVLVARTLDGYGQGCRIEGLRFRGKGD